MFASQVSDSKALFLPGQDISMFVSQKCFRRHVWDVHFLKQTTFFTMFCVKFDPYCSYLDSGDHQLQTKPEKKSPIKSVNQKSSLAENKDEEKH